MDCGMWVWREGGVVGESVHNARMSDLYVLNRPLVEVARRTMLTVIALVEVVAFFRSRRDLKLRERVDA